MADRNFKVNRILALIDSQAKFLSESTDEELVTFLDDDAVISNLQSQASKTLDFVLKSIKKKRLATAKEAFKNTQVAASQIRRYPSNTTERRTFLESLLSRSDFPQELTLAFRERKGQLSDAEIESALEDLESLGVLDSETYGSNDDS